MPQDGKHQKWMLSFVFVGGVGGGGTFISYMASHRIFAAEAGLLPTTHFQLPTTWMEMKGPE